MPKRRWTILSNPTNAPDKMKRILLVSTTKVSPFPPDAPPPPPLNPGSPSRTPFFPPGPAPNDRFIGLFGSQLGGSYPEEPDALGASAFVLPVGEVPGLGGVGVDEEDDVEEGVVADDEIGGGLAERVTFVPSSKRSKACCTPSPPTSLPPPQDPKSLPPLRASLSISSIWIIPILSSATPTLNWPMAYSVRFISYSAACNKRKTQFSTSSPTSTLSAS